MTLNVYCTRLLNKYFLIVSYVTLRKCLFKGRGLLLEVLRSQVDVSVVMFLQILNISILWSRELRMTGETGMYPDLKDHRIDVDKISIRIRRVGSMSNQRLFDGPYYLGTRCMNIMFLQPSKLRGTFYFVTVMDYTTPSYNMSRFVEFTMTNNVLTHPLTYMGAKFTSDGPMWTWKE